MPAWRRSWWFAVVLVSALGTQAQAGPLSSNGGPWNWWSSGQDGGTWSGSPGAANPWTPSANATPPPTPAPVAGGGQPTFSASSFAATTPSPTPVSGTTFDAFLNFGNGTYAEANPLTTGTIRPWYESPAVSKVFGGTPTPGQRSAFANEVLDGVKRTYQLSGIPISLTLDPKADANHTISVVSGASFPGNPNAVGVAYVGGSGFSFIDKLNQTQSVDQLAWAVAHNVAHELMHSFGVAAHHDQTGEYLDAAKADWSMLTDPDTTFSPAATQDIRSSLSQARTYAALQSRTELLGPTHKAQCMCPLCRRGYELNLAPSPVPEPATWAFWCLGAAAVLARRKATRGRVRPRTTPESR